MSGKSKRRYKRCMRLSRVEETGSGQRFSKK